MSGLSKEDIAKIVIEMQGYEEQIKERDKRIDELSLEVARRPICYRRIEYLAEFNARLVAYLQTHWIEAERTQWDDFQESNAEFLHNPPNRETQ